LSSSNLITSFNFSLQVATRYLWSKRSEAFISIITIISILGVAIGVMVLNVVMSVMTGFEHELRDKIVGTNSHITVRRFSGKINNWHIVKDAIEAIPGVKNVAPYTYNQALIRKNGQSMGILIRGIEAQGAALDQVASYVDDTQIISNLFTPAPFRIEKDDQTFDDVKLPGILVGKELARQLNLFKGEAVSVLSPQTSSTPFGLVPQYRRFVVAGSYSSGLLEYESGLAYISMEEAQKFFRLGDTVTGFEVRVLDIEQAGRIAQQIKSALDTRAPGFVVQSWTESNQALWEAIQLEKRAYFVVLLLIIVMASFSIVATLIMIVLEKRKDIAVLMTMGASPKSVAMIFRIQGAAIGLIGTLLGLILSVVGCVALKTYGFPLNEQVFQMKELPVRIELLNFVIVAISAFLICLLSTIYPAYRASRLEPAEVLRYE
jgi:lipoprotein-releasing system permease protein